MSIPAGAKVLLDFISVHESGGRYDVIYGHHERELASPITGWTIGKLLTEQIGWGRKWHSSAAGRYQIIQTTLSSLVRSLGISQAALFSSEAQDELGYELLRRRGYTDWTTDKLSTMAFARSLAQEWASLPVLANTNGAHGPVRAGQSYYAGDGLNKALVSTTAFADALARARAAK